MAKDKETKPETLKVEGRACVVRIADGETYRGDAKDESGNVTKVYLFYDPDFLKDGERIQMSQVSKQIPKHLLVTAKPGDTITIPERDFEMLSRAGAVKGV